MKYVHKTIDLDSGKPMWVDLGDHRPISEVAERLSIGPRTFRQILITMGLLQREWDGRAQQHRNRLAPWAVASRLGMRHDNTGFYRDPDRAPFDVLSPEGVEYIRDHLEEAYRTMANPSDDLLKARATLKEAQKRRRLPMDAEEQVSWLVAHHAGLSASDIAAIVEVDESLVRRYIRRRDRQIKKATELANKPLPKSEHATPSSARPPVVVIPQKLIGPPRDAWERGECDVSLEERKYPLWAPERLRKSRLPLWQQVQPDLLQVA